MALRLSQSQNTSQKQIQKISQVQIQSLKYLAMNSADLVNEIYNEIEKNPALEISEENFSEGVESVSDDSQKIDKDFGNLNDYTKISQVSSAAQEKADAFQSLIENEADLTETLSEHLIKQFELIKLPQNLFTLGKKLIYNLDKNGYHILAPVSFLDYEVDSIEDLDKCLNIIQNLDPCGCCCQNVSESLLIQAKALGNASELTLFILDDHLDFLNPLNTSRVLKRLKDFYKEESKKSFSDKDYSFLESVDEEDVEESISFIQKLNPHPASEYNLDNNSFVIPEICVKRVSIAADDDYLSNNLKSQAELEKNALVFNQEKKSLFEVHSINNFLPVVTISKEYEDLLKDKSFVGEERKSMEQMVQEGKSFIESLQYREDSILNIGIAIVKSQIDFFDKGPGHLLPLRQKDIAQILDVHETTISRMANSKFLECEWGLFPLKYFFVSAVAQDDESVSKDKILFEIKSILENQPEGKKKLSDQKLSEMLLERGIKVARRTVAKYRSQIGLGSSYERTE